MSPPSLTRSREEPLSRSALCDGFLRANRHAKMSFVCLFASPPGAPTKSFPQEAHGRARRHRRSCVALLCPGVCPQCARPPEATPPTPALPSPGVYGAPGPRLRPAHTCVRPSLGTHPDQEPAPPRPGKQTPPQDSGPGSDPPLRATPLAAWLSWAPREISRRGGREGNMYLEFLQ